MEVLDELVEKLAACSARDKQIREWQKIFKVSYGIFFFYLDSMGISETVADRYRGTGVDTSRSFIMIIILVQLIYWLSVSFPKK